MHHGAYVGVMWRSEVKLEESVLFFHYVGPGDEAALISLAAHTLTYEAFSLFYSLIFLPSFLSCFSHCLHGVCTRALLSHCLHVVHAWPPSPIACTGVCAWASLSHCMHGVLAWPSLSHCMHGGARMGLTLPLHAWGMRMAFPLPLPAWGARMGLTLSLYICLAIISSVFKVAYSLLIYV